MLPEFEPRIAQLVSQTLQSPQHATRSLYQKLSDLQTSPKGDSHNISEGYGHAFSSHYLNVGLENIQLIFPIM